MGARDVDLSTALGKIGSSSAIERKEGLADLEHVFRFNKNNHVIEIFKDKTWHTIFEALFKCTATERSAYLKATQSQKSRSTPRLTACGKALRITVTHAAKNIKAKTVKAVVDHILQTLPTATESYFAGLSLDYVKSLRLLLEYQPHVEHFRNGLWEDVLEFCLKGIAPLGSGVDEDQDSDDEAQATPGASIRTPSMSLTRRSRVSTPQSHRTQQGPTFRKEVDDLVACVHQLVRATNAPKSEHELKIVFAMRDFLSMSDSVRVSYNEAFGAINYILSETSTASLSLTKQMTTALIPLVKDLWSRKSASLRDEMLVTLVLTKDHVSAMVSDTAEAAFRIDLENLLEALQADYSKRLERDQLHMGDLVLDCTISEHAKSRLQLPVFALRRGRTRAESLWTLLHLTATYTAALDKKKDALQGRLTSNGDNAPPKRSRMTVLLSDDILRLASSSPTPATRLANLQYLCFLFQLRPYSAQEIQQLHEPLALCALDTNVSVGRWALLALTSLAAQSSSREAGIKDSWMSMIPQIARLLTVNHCSRPAAYLLYFLLSSSVLAYGDVTDIATTILDTLELQGPTSVNDASLALLRWLVEARAAENPSTATSIAERVIQWTFQKWTPSSFADKDIASQISSASRPHDFIDLFRRCGVNILSTQSASPVLCGAIGRAWYKLAAASSLAEYLLLENGIPFLDTSTKSSKVDASSGKSALSISLHIVDGLEIETNRTLETWQKIAGDRPQSLLPDMITAVLGLIMVNLAFTCQQDERIAKRIESLRRKCEMLTKAVMNVLSSPECEIEKVDIAVLAVADYLSVFSDEVDNESFPDDLTDFCVHFSSMLQKRQSGKTMAAASQESMDIDMGFDSQHSEVLEATASESVHRDVWTLSTDQTAFRRHVTAQSYLLTQLLKFIGGGRDGLSSSIVAYFTTLPPQDFFALRIIFIDILTRCNVLQYDGILGLFDHLASYLHAYEFSRHEVALLLHVDLLQATITSWAPTPAPGDDGELQDAASQSYEWFVETALENNICSLTVKTGLTDLFATLFKICGPTYVAYNDAPSVRTTLFKLLRSSDLPVLHRLINRLPEVFHHFTLDLHEDVFEDIHEKSMYTEKWIEGHALRMLLFCSLGSTWSTLMRRCLYHIFETAGTILETQVYATCCISTMAASVKLPDSQSLFRLFAGQLLYTWVRQSEGDWNAIPFSIFGYQSLDQLLFDVREEVYAQLMLRNQANELVAISTKIGLGQKDLALYSFARTLAYSLGGDSDYKSSRPAEKDRSETRLRALIGNQYSLHCASHVAKALGILLLRTNFEKKQVKKNQQKDQNGASTGNDVEQPEKDVVEGMFEKRFSTEKAANRDTTFEANALRAFKEMRTISSSEMRLPDPQQPMFRSRGFLEVADRLARRAKVTLHELFSAPVYVFVFRQLLSSLHNSLGSLHAILIVRKIRLLVALSGTSVLSGYALEITLHSLRSLLTEKQCTEDTLGIFQYLYANGVDYLKQNIKFVAGMNVTTLISLRKFAGSSQDSTTQESQHRSTINRAHSFRVWLVQHWFKKFAEGTEEKAKMQVLMELTSQAWGTGGSSNASLSTPESKLLERILDDHSSRRGLLPNAAWSLALELLCYDFKEPASYRDDILGLDHSAKGRAGDIWASCKNPNMTSQYLQWAARVLGRARNSTDFDVSTLLHSESMADRDTDVSGKETSLGIVVSTVASYLYAGDRGHAGLAEETLRLMFYRATKYQDVLTELQANVHLAAFEGLALMTEDVVVPVNVPVTLPLEECLDSDRNEDYGPWLQQLTESLVSFDADEAIVCSLDRILSGIPGIAEKLFPPVLHIVLEQAIDQPESVRGVLSQSIGKWFGTAPPKKAAHTRALLRAIMYLRRQPYPRETTHADRLKWLDLDFTQAAKAAHGCGMHTAALMLAELTSLMVPAKGPRRSTATVVPLVDEDTMLDIYRNIDDPDSFYGVPQTPSLDLVLSRLDHEAEGFKGLMFRGARMDSQMRMKDKISNDDNTGLLKSLAGINMNAIAYNLMSDRGASSKGKSMVDLTLKTAMKLEQWDVRVPESATTDTSTLYRVFQSMNNATSIETVRKDLDAGFLRTATSMLDASLAESTFRSRVNTLGVLCEIDDMVTSDSMDHLRDAWTNAQRRATNLISASPDEVSLVLNSREILTSTLTSNTPLRDALHISIADARRLQADALLDSCQVWSRRHGSQDALETVTCLSDLVPICAAVGVDVSKVVQNATADVLWAQGEQSTSIRMLQVLAASRHSKNEPSEVQQASIFAKLGHHVAEARLEPPNEIMKKYLMPAIGELKEKSGRVAGRVYHQFANFCYEQLQNQDNTDELNRAMNIKTRREAEVQGLTTDIKALRSQTERKAREGELSKARRWLRIDKAETERLLKVREDLIEQCLENYMLALSASDEHDNDVLRFYAIWLENTQSELANIVVSRHIDNIASYKFARLMNQLSSRMQADNSLFQQSLCGLVYRICSEHPFHGMHHITAGMHDPGTSHASSRSRHRAAKGIGQKLKGIGGEHGKLWGCIYTSDQLYHDVARYTDEEVARQGKEILLSKIGPTKKLVDLIPQLGTPPPTLTITLQPDLSYNDVPRVINFEPKMRVAGGLSAPKIITSRLNNGRHFKQLFKGGSDDLRQDAIMEQVFEEVSKLLGNHASTRQRKLRIRTYNVLPLSNTTGVLEFVKNTMAFQDILVPLHQTYHPKDLKSSACRTKIYDAAKDTTEARIKVYKDICRQFQPAMRYFFFERYTDPDEWFERRLAYTRSTAAISILGHVVGLGDRHLHNIMMDYVTGEVVHIDLGICFEAGRVLPIPELVPFRLTRDLVDGMGYTRTEGVFRRCCEFTLETLRDELESIMTLLNVLRYDPLYSWTVNAAKAKRLQKSEDDEGADRAMNEANMLGQYSSTKKDDDMGEAGRALAAVEKKLSKTLSKEATVSELIAQATDERNLALLFCGWSAWV